MSLPQVNDERPNNQQEVQNPDMAPRPPNAVSPLPPLPDVIPVVPVQGSSRASTGPSNSAPCRRRLPQMNRNTIRRVRIPGNPNSSRSRAPQEEIRVDYGVPTQHLPQVHADAFHQFVDGPLNFFNYEYDAFDTNQELPRNSLLNIFRRAEHVPIPPRGNNPLLDPIILPSRRECFRFPDVTQRRINMLIPSQHLEGNSLPHVISHQESNNFSRAEQEPLRGTIRVYYRSGDFRRPVRRNNPSQGEHEPPRRRRRTSQSEESQG